MEFITLEDKRHRVSITPELGGAIVNFQALHQDKVLPIFRPVHTKNPNPFDLGMNLMAPFSNRISNGGFYFDGAYHPIHPNLEGEQFPIHGDAFQKEWLIVEQSNTHVKLSLEQGEIGPFNYGATVEYSLDDEGLSCTFNIQNNGIRLPFGGGFHPWFYKDEQTKLKFKATDVWLEDERHLPTKKISINDKPEWNFKNAKHVPTDFINNAFVNWDGDLIIHQPTHSIDIKLKSSPPLTNTIIYCPNGNANFFCFEPVSHTVDAHNSEEHTELVVLKTGENLTLHMQIAWII